MEAVPHTPQERPSVAPTYRLPEADGTLSDGWVMSGHADAEIIAFSRPDTDGRDTVRGVDRKTYETFNVITPHTPQEIADLHEVPADQVVSIRPNRIFERDVHISRDENGRPQTTASEGVRATLRSQLSPDDNPDTDMAYISNCNMDSAAPNDLAWASCAAFCHNTHELYRLLATRPPQERQAIYDRMDTTLKPTWEQLMAVLPQHVPGDTVNVVRSGQTVAEAGWHIMRYDRLHPENGEMVDRYMVGKEENDRLLRKSVARIDLDAGNPV